MRRSRWPAVVFAFAAGFVATSGARDCDTIEVAKLGPKQGKSVTRESTFKIENATVTTTAGGAGDTYKQAITSTSKEFVEYIDVTKESGQINKVKTTVATQTVVIAINGKEADPKNGPLHGRVIISTRQTGGTWKHEFEKVEPMPEQKLALDQRPALDRDDALFPEDGMVKDNDKWVVMASKLQHLFGESLRIQDGTLFLERVKDEDLSATEKGMVITFSGSVKGVSKVDGGELTVELDVKEGKMVRSQVSGLDVVDTAKGTIRMSGKVTLKDRAFDLKLKGDFSVNGTAR